MRPAPMFGARLYSASISRIGNTRCTGDIESVTFSPLSAAASPGAANSAITTKGSRFMARTFARITNEAQPKSVEVSAPASSQPELMRDLAWRSRRRAGSKYNSAAHGAHSRAQHLLANCGLARAHGVQPARSVLDFYYMTSKLTLDAVRPRDRLRPRDSGLSPDL